MAMRLRSRQVTWSTGSMPSRARMALAAKLDMAVRAAGLSVRLTASTSPRRGSARAIRSAALAESGGVISAVTTSRPSARRSLRVGRSVI